jgi:High potential iron-sulfur protein
MPLGRLHISIGFSLCAVLCTLADARGGCNIFAGKSVAGGGWCSVWAKKT